MTTVLDALNSALHQAFADDERVYLIGQDLLDPYGGAFKVSKGLSSAYPERVITTPVSEAGLTGIAAGMALRGLRPVVEIMFGDFVALIADQLVNHIAKFRWMYNNQVRVPLVVRTPMGGRRGYGPTHSQTLEKIYLGVPGLRVLAACTLQAEGTNSQPAGPGELLYHAILRDDDPVLFIENKLLYTAAIQNRESMAEFTIQAIPVRESSNRVRALVTEDYAPTYTLNIQGAPSPHMTLAAYGYMAELAREALARLAYEHEIFGELVVPTQLAPPRAEAIVASARRTGRLLVIEEGSLTLGWGAEIAAQACEALGPELKCVRRLAGRDLPVPASPPLEAWVLPGVDEIVQLAKSMV